MIRATNYWLRRLGFHVWHVPGVSRAWRFEFVDGAYLLVTDLDGYDLPDPSGPYAAVAMSSGDEVIDSEPWLGDMNELFRWFRDMLQLCSAGRNQFDIASAGIDAFKRWEDRRKQMRSFLSPR